jgi:hypothetical protein
MPKSFFCSVCCCAGFYQKKAVMKKNQSSKRSLKVGASSVGSGLSVSDVPFIKLSGKWLKESGFCYGQQVSVVVSDQQLVIKVEKS